LGIQASSSRRLFQDYGKYIKNDPAKGSIITIENLDKMPMPVVMDIKFKSGALTRVKLPVEIWQRNNIWSFKQPSTEEIESITLDPDHVFPDVNEANNVWAAGKGELEKDVILDSYLGNFSSKVIPIKIILSEKDGALIAKATGQPDISLAPAGKDRFTYDQAGVIIQFNDSKNGFTLKLGEQTFQFSKDM